MSRTFPSVLAILALAACHAQPEAGPMSPPEPMVKNKPAEIAEPAPAKDEAEAEASAHGRRDAAPVAVTATPAAEPSSRPQGTAGLDDSLFGGGLLASAPAGPMTASGEGSGTSAVTTRPRATEGKTAAKLSNEERGYAPPPPSPSRQAYPAVAVAAPPPMVPHEAPAPDPKPVSAEAYKDYGINGFTLAKQDHTSTFAADVDTASYAIVRSKLRGGYLPPQDAVRVEEFVNYFPYEYKQPKPGDPFAVDFEAAPSPWTPGHHLVRIGVQGKNVAFDQRQPVHLTLLVDTSGSMQSENKIGYIKKTLKMLTEELEDGDTVALATYAGSTRVVLEPTPISRKADILRALDGLTAGGSTAMSSGIDLAYQLADRAHTPGSVSRVIVCSDGDANVGRTSHNEISAQIKGYAQKGITLTTVGFGNGNYKDVMMERLANDGDGNYYYIDTLNEARRVFVDKLTGTLEVIAKDVKLQVEWDPNQVVAWRLIGYENRHIDNQDFRNDAVDAGEIGAGHQVTALYEVVLADQPNGNVATVRVRNKAPGAEAPAVERAYTLTSKAVRPSWAETSAPMRIAVASGTFAEILRGSPYVNEVSLTEVARLARSAKRAEYPEDTELVELIEIAARLKGEGAMVLR